VSFFFFFLIDGPRKELSDRIEIIKKQWIPGAVAYQCCEHPVGWILVANLQSKSRIYGLPSTFLARCSATCREHRRTSRRPNIFRIYTASKLLHWGMQNRNGIKRFHSFSKFN